MPVNKRKYSQKIYRLSEEEEEERYYPESVSAIDEISFGKKSESSIKRVGKK